MATTPPLYIDFEQRIKVKLTDTAGNAYDASGATSILWYLSVGARRLTTDRSCNPSLGDSDWSAGLVEIQFGDDFTEDELRKLSCQTKANTNLNLKINSTSGYSQLVFSLVDLEQEAT